MLFPPIYFHFKLQPLWKLVETLVKLSEVMIVTRTFNVCQHPFPSLPLHRFVNSGYVISTLNRGREGRDDRNIKLRENQCFNSSFVGCSCSSTRRLQISFYRWS
ncbi:hypothetical protein OS493_011951 [Desmophyllum pertusum]|uniref:Uncharacterized protein n=1 Tax=Desmophyllum pertusum TaxID=174260 RepID=A0A9X0DA07_9CNID|nr:hypothetical protein OS493_011951 [Desmophyllum pertusum]